MNSQKSIPIAKTDVGPGDRRAQGKVAVIHRQLQYVAHAAIGILGGAIGVAFAIGLTNVVQQMLFPTVIYSPSPIGLLIIAILAGLVFAWLLGRLASLILPALLSQLDEQGVQIIMVFSVLTSLLQTMLFTNGL